MRSAAKWLSVIATAIVPLGACAPRFPSDPSVAQRLCDAMCARHVACQPSKWDAATCRAQCEADRATPSKYGGASRQYWREDYVDVIQRCLAAARCDVAEDEPGYLFRCFEDTLPAPSDLAKQVCARRYHKFMQCGGYPPPSNCAEDMTRFSDAVLSGADRCLSDDGCAWGVACWNDWASSTR